MVQVLIYLSLGGILAGLLAGLLGVGGGIVLVPLLTVILPLLGIEQSLVMHIAIATSMAVIAVTSISSARVHWQQGQVVCNLFRDLSLGTIVGTVVGVYFAHFLPGKGLHLIFGLFTLLLAIHTILGVKPKPQKQLPNSYASVLIGVVIGLSCALLGIGGGMLIVPYLNRYPLSMQSVISTSALCTMPIAVVGSLSFILMGMGQHSYSTIAWSTGYIYWPAFLASATAGVIFAPIGAKLMHRIPSHILKNIFGLFLAVVAIHMLISGIY